MTTTAFLKKYGRKFSETQIIKTIQDLKQSVQSANLEWRSDTTFMATTLALLRHFESAALPDENVAEWFEKGAQVIVDYYWGDWWTAENVNAWMQGRNDVGENQKLILQAGIPDRSPTYTGKVRLRRERIAVDLLVTVFAGKLDAAARVADWFDLRVQPKFSNGEVEEEYQLGMLYMLSRLRSTPIPGIDKVVQKIRKCRHERPKVFLDLIDAAFDGDQVAFSNSLPKSVELHFKKLDVRSALDLVAKEQSILAEIARKNGLTRPGIPEEFSPALMTPETIGLRNSPNCEKL